VPAPQTWQARERAVASVLNANSVHQLHRGGFLDAANLQQVQLPRVAVQLRALLVLQAQVLQQSDNARCLHASSRARRAASSAAQTGTFSQRPDRLSPLVPGIAPSMQNSVSALCAMCATDRSAVIHC